MSSGIINQYTGYHNRRSLRLYGYDYSRPGHYFVTFCVNDHARYFFGDVVQGKMILNEMGVIADRQFEQLPERFPNIRTETYQIMPNHIHAIITIRIPPVGATLAVAPSDLSMIAPFNYNGASSRAGASPAPTIVVNGAEQTTSGNSKNITIGDIIGAYKSLVFNNCLEIIKTKNEYLGKLWQRNYYDHIIRDEKSLFFIRNYILENPRNWDSDKKNHINKEFNEIEMTEHKDFTCQHFKKYFEVRIHTTING